MKRFIFIIPLLIGLLGSCGVFKTVWDSIKDRYKPYEFIGMEGDKVLVKFVFDSPSANEVWLAGQFNNWASSTSSPRYPGAGLDQNPVIPMVRDAATGFWTMTLPLNPGRYQYKYVLDAGRVWQPDPNTEHVPDGFGGDNSIIVVVASGE